MSSSNAQGWRKFADRRGRAILRTYPAALPSGRRYCPLHEVEVGAITGICAECRNEAWERIGQAFVARQPRSKRDVRAGGGEQLTLFTGEEAS